MAKRIVPIVIIMAMALLASTIMAQQMGLEQEAEDRRFEASELLGELNSRDFESQDARISLDDANSAFDAGMSFYDNQEWQNAIDFFNDAIFLGGQAVAYEEAGENIDEQPDMGIPLGGEIDIDSIGQGVSSDDFPMLMGIIFISIFVVLPVTYKLV